MLVGVQLHLPCDPRPVKVGVPPAFLLGLLGLLVLLSGSDERDAEVALLPVHRHVVLPGRDGRGQVVLGCGLDGGDIRRVGRQTEIRARG